MSTPEPRYWSKVNKTDTCWLWTASRLTKGYGQVARTCGERLAHRVSWVMANGPIPIGVFVLHKCDVPSCVNPDHLFLGTPNDNVQDMVAKGRQVSTKGICVGERHGRHKLTWSTVYQIREIGRSETLSQIAARFGMSKGAIAHILANRTWRVAA